MTIKQLSVFLENKTGRINDLTRILSREGINMHAFSMAETPDFGILRLIVSEVDRAYRPRHRYLLRRTPPAQLRYRKPHHAQGVPHIVQRRGDGRRELQL